MSRILHVVPGISDVSNGMAVVARLLVKEQGDADVIDLNNGLNAVEEGDVEEVWVHGMWLPKEWRVCRAVLRSGKRLVRMTHGSLSPVYLKHQSPLKKCLVSPIERYLLRKADKVVATCEVEVDWIQAYEPRVKSIEVMDIKRFFKLDSPKDINPVNPVKKAINLLYLGRRHPLKGLEYLEEAVREILSQRRKGEGCTGIDLRVVSNASGEEKEKVWAWCDVLILPTLSDNFGLVIAEALERGKRVITTDGAPAWGPEECESVEMLPISNPNNQSESQIWKGYGGGLIYLKGYRDGTPEERVRLLKNAIGELACRS